MHPDTEPGGGTLAATTTARSPFLCWQVGLVEGLVEGLVDCLGDGDGLGDGLGDCDKRITSFSVLTTG